MKNYYEILKVKSSASPEEIHKAYHALAKKYHPDANGNDPAKTAKFKEINDAFDFLQNPINRMGLDAELHMQEQRRKKIAEENEKEEFFKRMKDSGFDERKNEEYIGLLKKQLEEYEAIIEDLVKKTPLTPAQKYDYITQIRKNEIKRKKNPFGKR